MASSYDSQPRDRQLGERLDSWKAIAAFLHRDTRTVQRWEKLEGLPVHRHRHSKFDTVYAFSGELLAWQDSRKLSRTTPTEDTGLVMASTGWLDPLPAKSPEPSPVTLPGGTHGVLWYAALLVPALIACIAGAALFFLLKTRPRSGFNPNAVVTPLSAAAGPQLTPSFSPDGSQVAFVWNGEQQKKFGIYVKRVGSESVRRLTSDPETESSPAWSPDGKWIAFYRKELNQNTGIWMVLASGGAAHRLIELESGALPSARVLNWFPDGRFLVTSESPKKSSRSGVYRVDVASGGAERLTAPKTGEDDVAPAISPDGSTLAFVRDTGRGISSILLQPLNSQMRADGPPRQVPWTGFEHAYSGNPAWSPDSRRLVFSSNRGGDAHLWIGPIDGSQPARALPYGSDLEKPALSRRGDLAFEHELLNANVWRVALRAPGKGQHPNTRILASTRIQDSPRVSPDGRKLVFSSNRSGYSEIWTSNIDGSNPQPITQMEVPSVGSPDWSGDGKWIVYDARVDLRPQIFLIRAAAGAKPVSLTPVASSNVVPVFSVDSAWIYFTSSRSGIRQIWKMRLDGSNASQVTVNGGFAALPTPDNKSIIYSRDPSSPAPLWKMDLASGSEQRLPVSALSRAFAPARGGLYFAAGDGETRPTLCFLPNGSSNVQRLTAFDKPLRLGMGLSPDESNLYYSQVDQSSQDLLLVKDFWR